MTQDTRFREVVLDSHGDLVWHGHDLGPAVGALMPGSTEYEFWRYVRARDLPALLEALGGSPGDDVAALVSDRFASDVELNTFAKSLGITTEFHNWITTDWDD